MKGRKGQGFEPEACEGMIFFLSAGDCNQKSGKSGSPQLRPPAFSLAIRSANDAPLGSSFLKGRSVIACWDLLLFPARLYLVVMSLVYFEYAILAVKKPHITIEMTPRDIVEDFTQFKGRCCLTGRLADCRPGG